MKVKDYFHLSEIPFLGSRRAAIGMLVGQNAKCKLPRKVAVDPCSLGEEGSAIGW